MDIFGDDVVAEIERDRIQQVEIHRVIRERDLRDLVDAAMLQPEFGDEQVVGQGVPIDGRDGGEDHRCRHQQRQDGDQSPDDVFLGDAR